MVKDECAANLSLWLRNGSLSRFRARVTTDVDVSVGRTNSKKALGFVITKDGQHTDFVLDHNQVEDLIGFLQYQLPRLRKPRGKRVSPSFQERERFEQ